MKYRVTQNANCWKHSFMSGPRALTSEECHHVEMHGLEELPDGFQVTGEREDNGNWECHVFEEEQS